MYCYCFAQDVRTTVQVEASRWRSFVVAVGATARTSSSLERRYSYPDSNSTCKQFTSSMFSKRMLKSNTMHVANWLSRSLADLPQYVSSVRLPGADKAYAVPTADIVRYVRYELFLRTQTQSAQQGMYSGFSQQI